MKAGAKSRMYLALLMGPLCVSMSAPESRAESVSESGFCISVTGRDCTNRLSSGQRVSMEALERNEQGQRVLYFQSSMVTRQGELFVHAWERSGPQDAGVKVYSKNPLSDEARQSIESFRLGVLNDALNVVVEASADSPAYRAVSNRSVLGPGKIVGKVVDSKGQDFPGSQLHEVEIVP